MDKQGNIDLYVIKYIIRPAWTLREAAYLLCGEDPETSTIKCGPKYNTVVSSVYEYLFNLREQGKLRARQKGPVFPIKGKAPVASFSVDQFLVPEIVLDYEPRLELQEIRHFFLGRGGAKKYANKFSIALYRLFAQLILDEDPTRSLNQISEKLVELPSVLMNDRQLFIQDMSAHAIRKHLNGMKGTSGGRLKSSDSDSQPINLSQILNRI